jgi:hypothetical protein
VHLPACVRPVLFFFLTRNALRKEKTYHGVDETFAVFGAEGGWVLWPSKLLEGGLRAKLN